MWNGTTYRKKLFERLNYAFVVKVDGDEIPESGIFMPVELAPGRHGVAIKYERDSYLCGYFGCVRFEQSVRSLELLAEADHSYLPVARKACDRDWFWIVDLGEGARQRLDLWREHGIRPYSLFDARSFIREITGLKVVAGEEPPEQCEADRE